MRKRQISRMNKCKEANNENTKFSELIFKRLISSTICMSLETANK